MNEPTPPRRPRRVARCPALLPVLALATGCANTNSRGPEPPAAMPTVLQGPPPVAAASVAVIRAESQTPYGLVLRYSGPTSQRLSLKPQQSAQMRLAPGTDAVAATAESAQGVRPFAGVQQIQGGTYASSWIIRTVVR